MSVDGNPSLSNPDSGEGSAVVDNAEQSKDSRQSQAKEKLDGALNDTSDKLRNLAQKVEDYGRGASENVGQATEKVSEQLNRGAQALQGTSVDRLLEQFQDVIKRQPLTSIGIALGVGYFLSRIAKR